MKLDWFVFFLFEHTGSLIIWLATLETARLVLVGLSITRRPSSVPCRGFLLSLDVTANETKRKRWRRDPLSWECFHDAFHTKLIARLFLSVFVRFCTVCVSVNHARFRFHFAHDG